MSMDSRQWNMLHDQIKEYNRQRKIENMINSLQYFNSEDTKKILERLKREFGLNL